MAPLHLRAAADRPQRKARPAPRLGAGRRRYLTKPFDAAELRARLLVGQRILNLRDDLIAAREELRFRTTHDALTGMTNRAMVMDALSREAGGRNRSELASSSDLPNSRLPLEASLPIWSTFNRPVTGRHT